MYALARLLETIGKYTIVMLLYHCLRQTVNDMVSVSFVFRTQCLTDMYVCATVGIESMQYQYLFLFCYVVYSNVK